MKGSPMTTEGQKQDQEPEVLVSSVCSSMCSHQARQASQRKQHRQISSILGEEQYSAEESGGKV